MLLLVRALNAGPVRDLGLIESAAARAQSSFFGEETYPTLELKAAALLQSLCKNHPLVDGNKRLSWLATFVFVRINDRVIDMTDNEGFDLVMDIAANSMDLAEIGDRLKLVAKSL